MLEEKDLQAISQLMDKKFDQQKTEILGETTQMFAQQKTEILGETSQMLAQQKTEILGETTQMLAQQKTEILGETSQMLAQQKTEILDETTHRMKLLLDTEVRTQFNLLAEGQQSILEKLVPRSRVDDLEDEVKFLKSIVRQMNEDLQDLKKAN